MEGEGGRGEEVNAMHRIKKLNAIEDLSTKTSFAATHHKSDNLPQTVAE